MTVIRNIKPQEIEAESFRIIESEFQEKTGRKINDYDPKTFAVIRRVIHATGDFSFCESLLFSERSIEAGLNAIHQGKNIIVDVNMAAAGITKSILGRYGGKVICNIADPEVIEKAKKGGNTRSEIALKKAADENIGIVVVGNAPTALLMCMDLIEKGLLQPDLVIGVPVGFVNAAESKEILSQKEYPFITSIGRKGGSPVAAAIVNAILRFL